MAAANRANSRVVGECEAPSEKWTSSAADAACTSRAAFATRSSALASPDFFLLCVILRRSYLAKSSDVSLIASADNRRALRSAIATIRFRPSAKVASVVRLPCEPEVIFERLAGNRTREPFSAYLDLELDGLSAARHCRQRRNVRVHITPVRLLSKKLAAA
jgi:hypothetical protein